ncbi:MAG TPA: enoyl-CoA hydratase/isomerase family protein [Candidatus Binatia bacterium]|nr:enoyl-CoA hydratase/isomerase family protein [Candidatus Binatia bacterium]
MPRPSGAVTFGRRGHLAELVLDLRESGGRFTAESAVAFSEACARCDDEGVWVVLLRSAGPDFCVGIEGRFSDWPRVSGTDFVASLAAIRQPVVLAARGRVEAEGFELALAADLRVVEPRTRFLMAQITAGALPRFGGSQRLPRLIGVERTLRTLLLAERIPGRTAFEWGLATRLAGNADRRAFGLAQDLLERGPLSLRFAKEAVLRSLDLALDDGARFEHDLYVLLETTRDRAEGVDAFLGKRKPRFRGC